ncbi:MFS transporter [Arthrobacter sp. H14]|uniref:MFS transporter n=1 Tax=Arthrobacter sp. H14 TaxID=1312959 RepID=UPI00047A0A35|nr:MFS transporter [Arthrobacter sp. H14]
MSTQDDPEAYAPDPARWRVLSVLLVTIFMSLVGVSIVNVALPSIQQGLGATQSDIQWVLSGYALTFGVVLVAAGRAGDILGRGPLFIAGVSVFTLSSIAAGLAPDPLSLNIARFVQGVGSGLLNPQAVGMIQQYFRGAERGRAFGYFGTVVGLSVAVGPLLGGLLIELGGVENGWRWTFLVNVPVGILAIVLALRWFPRPLRAGRMGSRRRDLDPIGALLLGLAVLTVLLPFVETDSSAWIWALLPASGLLVLLWALWERRYKARGRSPMVDLAIFRTASFSNGALLVSLYFTGMTSIFVLIALYFQEGLGHSALESGAVGVPSAILGAIAANWGGKVVMRFGRKLVIGGMFCALAGLALSILVIQLAAAGMISEWWLLASLGLVGVGQGAVITPNQTLTLADVPLEYAGSSGGIMQTGQRIGTSVGIAMITAVAFAVLGMSNWPQAITAGFIVIGAVILLALVVAFHDLHRRQRNLEKVV